LDGVSSLGGAPVKLGWDVFNSSPLSGRHTDGTNIVNLSAFGGRHGGTEVGGLPIHPLVHSAFDSLDTPATTPIKLGRGVTNLSALGGRHGGELVDGALTPHPSTHSLLDIGVVPASTPVKVGATLGTVNYFSGTMGLWGFHSKPTGFVKKTSTSQLVKSGRMVLDSKMHTIPQITVSGPFGNETYQSTLNTTMVVPNAHNSVFTTSPLSEYSSQYSPSPPDSAVLTLGKFSTDTQLGDGSPDFNNLGFSSTKAYSDGGYLLDKYSDTSIFGNLKYGDRLKGTGFFDKGGIYNKFQLKDDTLGFSQPFITKDVGDRWGIDALGDLDMGVVRGGINTAIARTLSDELRLGKFILTTRGILFGAKQLVLQRFNTKAETRTWNPLSIFGSAVPTIHVRRHVDVSDESAMHDLAILARNPYGWAEGKLKGLRSPEGKAPEPAKTSLISHFDKEEAILKFNRGGGDLINKLAQARGISFGAGPEQSRQLDDESFAFNSLKQASLDTGDQGTPGVVHMNYDLTKLGATLTDNFGDAKYITSKVDKVNATPYGSTKGKDPSIGKDFIPFKFYDKVNKKWIIFRASLSGISDSISPEWSEEKYIGRPDKVYTYQGVDRKVSFQFQIYPKTKQELPILWEKLNYLVGMCYPSWDKSDRMVAPFMELTIGNLWKDTPGKLDSVSITVEDNSTWEYDIHFQLPKFISVNIDFTYIGKYKPDAKGLHYELDWIAGPVFDNYPLRTGQATAKNAAVLSDLFAELNQPD